MRTSIGVLLGLALGSGCATAQDINLTGAPSLEGSGGSVDASNGDGSAAGSGGVSGGSVGMPATGGVRARAEVSAPAAPRTQVVR